MLAVRIRYFTPWAPLCGQLGNIYFLTSLEEKSKKWKAVGVLSGIVMITISRARLGQVCLIIVPVLVFILSRLRSGMTITIGGIVTYLTCLIGTTVAAIIDNLWSGFKNARADSTRVRAYLKSIAIRRWRSEAPVWGHGVVEKGPHIVEYMPIGSHDSWASLLFVKGFVGVLAFGVPLVATFIEALRRSNCRKYQYAKLTLGLIITLMIYTNSESLEVVAYITWPALLLIGIGIQEGYSPNSKEIEMISQPG